MEWDEEAEGITGSAKRQVNGGRGKSSPSGVVELESLLRRLELTGGVKTQARCARSRGQGKLLGERRGQNRPQ